MQEQEQEQEPEPEQEHVQEHVQEQEQEQEQEQVQKPEREQEQEQEQEPESEQEHVQEQEQKQKQDPCPFPHTRAPPPTQSEWVCTVCLEIMPVESKTCPGCEADFSGHWFCYTCNGPVPGQLDECMQCGIKAPIVKIPDSAILYLTDPQTNKQVVTAFGHAAARQGEEEGKGGTHHQGRAAKGRGIEKRQATKAPSKVQALTLKKDILVLVWSVREHHFRAPLPFARSQHRVLLQTLHWHACRYG